MKYSDESNGGGRKCNATRKGQLVPYYLHGINQPMRFNNTQIVADGKEMPGATDVRITNLPEE